MKIVQAKRKKIFSKIKAKIVPVSTKIIPFPARIIYPSAKIDIVLKPKY